MKEKTIYALGFFDGVHLGHQTILYACKRIAEQTGATTGAITFEDHPQSLFVKDCPGLINTTADRCSLLRQYGMDTSFPAYMVMEKITIADNTDNNFFIYSKFIEIPFGTFDQDLQN